MVHSLADSINYGMLLMPTNTNVIKGFFSFNSYRLFFVPN